MCGIAGLLDPGWSGTTEELASLARAMAQPLAHRGPDDEGTWCDAEAGLGFGHRRLAIIDLSPAGHQPMVSADGRWVATYNGECYNAAELRAALPDGGRGLRGHCDTEVVVEAVASWGLRPTLERLDAMFALALWDRRDRVLHLTRDRLGEKPLYYSNCGRRRPLRLGAERPPRLPRFQPGDRPAGVGLPSPSQLHPVSPDHLRRGAEVGCCHAGEPAPGRARLARTRGLVGLSRRGPERHGSTTTRGR